MKIPHSQQPGTQAPSALLRLRLALSRQSSCLAVLASLAGLTSGCVVANKSTPAPSPAPAAGAPTGASPKPAPTPTHTVKKGPLKKVVQLDAVFESTTMEPIRFAPKAWLDFTVVSAIPHGARVKKGDILLAIDRDKIKEQIDDLETDRPAMAAALQVAQAELENLTTTTPHKLEATRKSQRIATEEFGHFDNIGRERRKKASEMNLKSSQQRVNNAKEELAQLEKMYKADDLTEETEEIVVKRQRFEVEYAEFSLESTRIHSERELSVMIPREDENLKSQKRDQDHALALSEITLPKALERKRLEVEKLQRDQRKSQKRLADLKADHEMMEVRAPFDGLLLYGACENGRWPNGAAMAKMLLPGRKAPPFEVVMTVVDSAKLQLRASCPEAELGRMQTGATGEATLVSAPGIRLAAKVEKIESVPSPAGGFDTWLSFSPATAAALVPGMNAKVSLPVKAGPESVLVPNEAIFAEGLEKEVYVQKGGGKAEKRSVKTGDSDGKITEVYEGLSDGDKVHLKKPE